jgi:hypothetical protein
MSEPSDTQPEGTDEELVQVVVSSFPKALLDEIDAEAKLNNRTRAAEIRHTLAERMAERRSAQAA